MCLWGSAAKAVVLLALPLSFDIYSDVVGGKDELQAISAWISNVCLWVARGRALDATQKQNFFVCLYCELAMFPTAKMAFQNVSAEDAMDEDTFYHVLAGHSMVFI